MEKRMTIIIHESLSRSERDRALAKDTSVYTEWDKSHESFGVYGNNTGFRYEYKYDAAQANREAEKLNAQLSHNHAKTTVVQLPKRAMPTARPDPSKPTKNQVKQPAGKAK